MSQSVCCLVAVFILTTSASAVDPKLTAEDAKYLDKLLADCLFDPAGAERVRGEFPVYSPSGRGGHVTREGWLVPRKKGEPTRVYFTDGLSLRAPDNLIGLNFVDQCKELYSKEKPK